jgi:hypothetical protein
MPVEIRELVIRASIEQKPEKVVGAEINEELIEKIKNEIKSEIAADLKEKIDELIYNK